MKPFRILFVCRGNIGRSQMAEMFAREILGDKFLISSCGIVAQNQGLKICEIPNDAVCLDIQAMKELNLDMSQNVVTKITSEIVASADKIVVMVEKSTWPDCLNEKYNLEHWQIENPKNCSFDKICKIRDEIQSKVFELANEMKNSNPR